MIDPKPRAKLAMDRLVALGIVAFTLIVMCGLASWAWVATH